MCTRQGNFLLHLNLLCLMECKIPGLHGTTLLSAPRIFALPNCFGPGFLCTTCPLSLSLPILLRISSYSPPPSYDPLPPSSCGSLLTLYCASPLTVPRASFGANVPQPTLLAVPQSPLPAATARCRTTAQNHKEAEETMSNKS